MAEALSIDNLYLENLEEFVFDDVKFVSYKWLACKMGVHVNVAKQMLYKFAQEQKEKKRNVHVLYYISGWAKQKWINSLDEGQRRTRSVEEAEQEGDDEGMAFATPTPDIYGSEEEVDVNENEEALLMMVVDENELEKMKEQFVEILSIHVYGVSKNEMTRKKLNFELQHQPKDESGRGASFYGPIKQLKTQEYKPNPKLVPIIQNIQQVKARVQADKERFEKENEKAKVMEPVPELKKELVKPTTVGGGKDKNRLKNMFAAVAAKPKVERKVQVQEVKKPTGKSEVKVKLHKEKADKKKRESEGRKRKRIRDVFSSSSDEENETEIQREESEESDTLPESPLPRRNASQLDFDSESDDDDFKSNKTKPKEEIDSKQEKKSGKRRVAKTVPKRHVDEDGFLVTVLETVMVSESDWDEEVTEKPTKVKTEEKEDNEKEPKQVFKLNEKMKETSKTSKPQETIVGGKIKQSSITAFFKKQ